jgi:ribonuclease PH
MFEQTVMSLRSDGRDSSSLRPLSCELGCLQNADGSALWKSGATHVIASVHGPLTPRQSNHERENAAVSVVIKSGQANQTYEREWENVLTQVLSPAIAVETYKRSVIQIVIQILSTDGSVLGACLHVAVSALMDASIDLNFLPTASSCLIQADGTIQLDPTAAEEQSAGTMVVITSPESAVLATHSSFMDASIDKLLQCCAIATKAGPAVRAFWRLVMEQRVTRETQTLWTS